MRYLLDTNVVSDLIRNPHGQVAESIKRVGEEYVCTSIVVASELRYGAARKKSPRLSTRVDAVLGCLEVLPLEPPADSAYAVIRNRLEQAGKPIGGNDLLIAAHAIALGFTLVTDNEREFARIPELSWENWVRNA